MADWLPQGRSTVAPFLIVADGEATIAFATEVFGATLLRPPLFKPDGSLWNAELSIGNGTVMVGSGGPDMRVPGFVHVYVPDADAAHARALKAGATQMMPVAEQFYGDRAGGVTDSQGTMWWIASHSRDLSDDELREAARQEFARRTA